MELACIMTCNDLKLLFSLECLFEGGWRVLGMIRLQPVEFEWADSVGTESMVHGREV
jgi:hypothetical protein